MSAKMNRYKIACPYGWIDMRAASGQIALMKGISLATQSEEPGVWTIYELPAQGTNGEPELLYHLERFGDKSITISVVNE